MRVLITGSCGFVGATLARGLRESRPDLEIVGLDNFVRPGSETNRGLLRELGVKVSHGDIRNPADLEALAPCDWILDAAANPSVLAGVEGQTSSRRLMEHNLIGTVNMLELAKGWRSGLIIFSTSRVYSLRGLAAIPVEVKEDKFVPTLAGKAIMGLSVQGIAETFSTEPPLSLYGASKRASEVLALEYGDAFDLPVFINRCGVLAGAGQFGRIDQGIFSFWIHSYCHRRPLAYIGFGGEGHQVRDCLHPRDLLSLVLRQMENPGTTAPRVINVSGGLAQSTSLRQLSCWCGERFGPHEIMGKPATRPFDVPWLVLDSRSAGAAWGWTPQTRLEKILAEIAEHAERNPRWLAATAEA